MSWRYIDREGCMIVVCMFVCVFGWGLVMRLMSGGRQAGKAQEQHERTMMEETETGIQKTRSENGVTCKKRYAESAQMPERAR